MNEAQTRLDKIDPKLRDAGWGIVPGSKSEILWRWRRNAQKTPIKTPKNCHRATDCFRRSLFVPTFAMSEVGGLNKPQRRFRS